MLIELLLETLINVLEDLELELILLFMVDVLKFIVAGVNLIGPIGTKFAKDPIFNVIPPETLSMFCC